MHFRKVRDVTSSLLLHQKEFSLGSQVLPEVIVSFQKIVKTATLKFALRCK